MFSILASFWCKVLLFFLSGNVSWIYPWKVGLTVKFSKKKSANSNLEFEFIPLWQMLWVGPHSHTISKLASCIWNYLFVNRSRKSNRNAFHTRICYMLSLGVYEWCADTVFSQRGHFLLFSIPWEWSMDGVKLGCILGAQLSHLPQHRAALASRGVDNKAPIDPRAPGSASSRPKLLICF